MMVLGTVCFGVFDSLWYTEWELKDLWYTRWQILAHVTVVVTI